MIEEIEVQPTASAGQAVPWWAYVAPMAVFLGITYLEGLAPSSYVWIYVAKVCAVTAALIACRAAWQDVKFEWHAVGPGVVVGLAVLAIWVAGEKWIAYPHLVGNRSAFDPFVSIASPSTRYVFLATRFFGLALMVPVMEELFWRSFLIRYLTTAKWRNIPPWEYSWPAFAMVAAGFGLEHPEWLVAVVCAVAYGLLLRQTKSLFACIVAHAATNLGLGIYVIYSGAWQLW